MAFSSLIILFPLLNILPQKPHRESSKKTICAFCAFCG
jgi:hypothetical protein